jgi:hypothetical protein
MCNPTILVRCIALQDSPRRETFARNAKEHSLQFEFFDAISIDNLRQGVAVNGCKIDLTDLNWTFHERRDPRRQHAPLMFAEIACAYSHITCWRRAKEASADYLVMFEDDAVICRSLRGMSVPSDADILYLSNRMPQNERGEACGYGCGAEGYILSHAGISKCLDIFSVLYMPIDLQLMAHQQSQILAGHGITRYRRKLVSDAYLKAYVTPQPYCVHTENGSQIFAAKP